MADTYDLVIVGGGPAGVAAGVYAARKRLRTLLVTETFGGQSIDSQDVQNWIGTISLSGIALAENLKNHLTAYAEKVVDINEGERVVKVEKRNGLFSTVTNTGKSYDSKAVLLTSGSHRRKLEVAGAREYEHRGITYCASCDGPLFADKDVVVIGGGNAGFETAAQLLAYTKSVTLLQREPEFKADPITVEKVLKDPKMKGLTNIEITNITGAKGFVTGISYKDRVSGQVTELPTDGIFVEIGLIPTTDMVNGLVDMDEYNRIQIDPRTQRTSIPGIWAAGDCTDVLYHQNNIAAGDAVRALEDIYLHLKA